MKKNLIQKKKKRLIINQKNTKIFFFNLLFHLNVIQFILIHIIIHIDLY